MLSKFAFDIFTKYLIHITQHFCYTSIEFAKWTEKYWTKFKLLQKKVYLIYQNQICIPLWWITYVIIHISMISIITVIDIQWQLNNYTGYGL